jgi:hypothetical protein
MKSPIIAVVVVLMSVSTSLAVAKPLKVYILAGQSNMQGHHDFGAAKIMAPIGKAFAEAMVKLQKTERKQP